MIDIDEPTTQPQRKFYELVSSLCDEHEQELNACSRQHSDELSSLREQLSKVKRATFAQDYANDLMGDSTGEFDAGETSQPSANPMPPTTSFNIMTAKNLEATGLPSRQESDGISQHAHFEDDMLQGRGSWTPGMASWTPGASWTPHFADSVMLSGSQTRFRGDSEDLKSIASSCQAGKLSLFGGPAFDRARSCVSIEARWEYFVARSLRKTASYFNFRHRAGWADPVGHQRSLNGLEVDMKINLALAAAGKLEYSTQKRILQTAGGGFVTYRKKPRERLLAYRKNRALTNEYWVPTLHPASTVRQVWLCLLILVVFYEVIAITTSPFRSDEDKFAMALEHLSAVFWTLDIVVNFFTGAFVNGKAELRFVAITKLYIRTWFLFDALVASMQWVAIYHSSGDVGAAGFLVKLARFARSWRIGRFLCMIVGEDGTLYHGFQVVQFTAGILLFVHCSACIYYELGKGDDGWVEINQKLGKMSNDDGGLNYLIAVHWSLSQLQGNIDLFPGRSVKDRLTIVISSCFSIVALALFVSTMTDTLFSARQESRQKTNEARWVKKYFERHRIRPDLVAQARFFMRSKTLRSAYRDLAEQDEKALRLFPTQLRLHLLAEARAIFVIWHPTFEYLQKYHLAIFVKVCSDAMYPRMTEPEEDLFAYGERLTSAYFFEGGDFVFNIHHDVWMQLSMDTLQSSKAVEALSSLDPRQDHRHDPTFVVGLSSLEVGSKAFRFSKNSREESMAPSGYSDRSQAISEAGNITQTKVRRLSKGHFICEAAWWTEWVHGGDLCSVDHGHIVTIDGADLVALLLNHTVPHIVFSSFAFRYVKAAPFVQKEYALDLITMQAVLEYEQIQEKYDDQPIYGSSAGSVPKRKDNRFQKKGSVGSLEDSSASVKGAGSFGSHGNSSVTSC